MPVQSAFAPVDGRAHQLLGVACFRVISTVGGVCFVSRVRGKLLTAKQFTCPCAAL